MCSALALAMHQSTVCRSVALISEQFRLQSQSRAGVLRYGSNESLQLLRLSYRAHRMMDGLLRIATDPLHQPLLAGMVSVQAVPPRMLPLQLVSHRTATADDSTLRKVLLPRRNVTPLLHEALAWHGFQVEQQPISCQDVPSWLKRMHDRQLAMPLCPGLMDPGWIKTQGLVPHPEQPHFVEQPEIENGGTEGGTRQAGPTEASSKNYAASA